MPPLKHRLDQTLIISGLVNYTVQMGLQKQSGGIMVECVLFCFKGLPKSLNLDVSS